MKSYCVCNVCEQYGGCMHMEEALAVENWVKSVKFCLYSTKTRCYGGVQQAHPMKSTENLISICKRLEFFPAKQESQEKTSNLTEQLTDLLNVK